MLGTLWTVAKASLLPSDEREPLASCPGPSVIRVGSDSPGLRRVEPQPPEIEDADRVSGEDDPVAAGQPRGLQGERLATRQGER